MAQKTLITGGAGFIGSHLAQRLRQQGRSLILVDNLSTGRRSNIESLIGPDCQFIEADAAQALADSPWLDDVVEIYHLAAAVGVKRVVDDPAGMMTNNIDQTLAVIQAAKRIGAALLITSSSEVYGKCPILPLHEDMELVYGPTTASRWGYGMTKAIDEHLAIDYHRRHGLRAVVVRLFNTIGPRQVGHYGMVVPRFVAAACANQPISVYGDGEQTRAFCDVRDVTWAMTQLLSQPQCAGRVFNIGSTRQITINELADLVLTLSGSTAGICHVPYEQVYGPDFEDPPHRLPDVTRVVQAIGFKRRYTLEQSILELVHHAQASTTA